MPISFPQLLIRHESEVVISRAVRKIEYPRKTMPRRASSPPPRGRRARKAVPPIVTRRGAKRNEPHAKQPMVKRLKRAPKAPKMPPRLEVRMRRLKAYTMHETLIPNRVTRTTIVKAEKKVKLVESVPKRDHGNAVLSRIEPSSKRRARTKPKFGNQRRNARLIRLTEAAKNR